MIKTEQYCITTENVLSHEIIGLDARIENSPDPNKIGLTGRIINETKNTFTIETNEGEKIVPKDLELTPKKCLYWYLDDGSLQIKNARINQICLATMGFKTNDNLFLIELIKNTLDIKKGIRLGNRGNIWLTKIPSITFLKYIGNNSPIKAFNYKFTNKNKNI